MRTWTGVACLAAAAAARAELVDRVAVSIGTSVITESELLENIRVTAFLNGRRADFGEESRRGAGDRLIDQAIIEREMGLGQYPAVDAAQVEAALGAVRTQRFGGADERLREALREHGVTEDAVRALLARQLTMLRFIDLRFRPSIQVTADEVSAYYREEFVPRWRERQTQLPPDEAEVAETLRRTLVEQRVNQALDRWLSQSRLQLDIRLREPVFRGRR
ncbi:MAG: hypothetical protein FJW40_17195 [Acidobacteria bacterium]|nr:hypothetical protein [Acidobacteriota bacterium]